MADSDRWFATDYATGISALKRDADVTFLVDAEEYYTDLRREVEATTAGDFICWIGFDVGRRPPVGESPPDFVGRTPMPARPETPPRRPFAARAWKTDDRVWLDLLTDASNTRRVGVRALLNIHPKPKPADIYKSSNFELVNKVNAMTNGGAINDFSYLWLNGTHHQKLVVIINPRGIIAYVGTMDVQADRIVNRWCELQCKVRGGSLAVELYNVFYTRWSEHSEAIRRLGPKGSIPTPGGGATPGPSSGRFLAEVGTTYGNPTRSNPLAAVGPPSQVVNEAHCVDIRPRLYPPIPIYLQVGNDFFLQRDSAAAPLIAEARRQSPSYGGPRARGTTGIYHMIKKAISATKEFIYVEDQYLVCDLPMDRDSVHLDSMAKLLSDKLKEEQFKKLIVFCPRLYSINDDMLGVAGPHRRAFIQALTNAGGNKVVVCQYKSNRSLGLGGPADGSPFYIHSKTWVFDDEFLITGSANCNRRGYSHDSELDVSVFDPNKTAVRDLRIKLWLRRLNTEQVATLVTEADVTDPIKGADYWENPTTYKLTIENHRIGLDPFLGNWYPRGLQTASGWAALQPSSLPFTSIAGMAFDTFMWDFVVDPNGV